MKWWLQFIMGQYSFSVIKISQVCREASRVAHLCRDSNPEPLDQKSSALFHCATETESHHWMKSVFIFRLSNRIDHPHDITQHQDHLAAVHRQTGRGRANSITMQRQDGDISLCAFHLRDRQTSLISCIIMLSNYLKNTILSAFVTIHVTCKYQIQASDKIMLLSWRFPPISLGEYNLLLFPYVTSFSLDHALSEI